MFLRYLLRELESLITKVAGILKLIIKTEIYSPHVNISTYKTKKERNRVGVQFH
jgi:hypothetical protein